MFSPALAIRITADSSRAKAGIDAVRGQIDSLAKKEVSAAAAGFDRLTAAISRVGHYGALAFGGNWVAGKAAEIIGVADTMSNLDARLRMVTSSAQEFVAAQETLRTIAQQTQAPLAKTITLFNRLAPAIKDAGGSQATTLAITQVMADTLKVSGASAQEAASSMLQFSQAMASGKLRGDEFNSIAEANPRLMRALADGLNVPVGKLREMAEQGNLTADVVGNALLGQMERLRTEAAAMPLTVGGAMTNLKNSFAVLVGDVNKQSGATASLVTAINALANNLDNLAGLLVTSAKLAAVWAGAFIALPRLLTAIAVATRPAAAGLMLLYQTGGVAAVAQAILGIGTAARTATPAVMGLGVAMKSAFALYAVYELAKYLLDVSLNARLFVVALVKTYGTAWEQIKFGALAMWEGIKAAWETSINWVKDKFAGLISAIGKGMSYIPGMGEAAGRMLAYADSLRTAAGNAETLGGRLNRLRTERDANIKALQDEADRTADFLIAEDAAGRAKPGAGKPGALRGMSTGGDAGKDDVLERQQEAAKAMAAEYERVFAATRTPIEQFNIEMEKAKALLAMFGDEDLFKRQSAGAQQSYQAGVDRELDKDPEVQRQRQIAQSFVSLQESLKSENQLYEEAYFERAAVIQAALAQQVTDTETAQAMMQQLTLDYAARTGDADAKATLAAKSFKEKTTKEQTKFVLGQAVALTAGMAQQNRTAFEINKAAGIANALISTYEGAAAALKLGPPASFFLVPLHIAAGLAQVAAIRSQQFTGGGGAASAPSFGGSGSVGAFPASPSTGLPLSQFDDTTNAPKDAGKTVNIYVNGHIIDHTAFVREMQPYFTELARDTI